MKRGIVGGSVVGGRKYPFFYQLKIRRLKDVENVDGECGSTLINPLILLTAAHCIFSNEDPDDPPIQGYQNIFVNFEFFYC